MARRLAVRSFFALLAVLTASAAWAAPSINVVAPPPGQSVYDVQPTMTVTYYTDTPQVSLNLETLRITVNGIDWTARFTKGTSSATYAVSTVDALVAGTLTVEAFIADQGGGSASATETYEVFPTLRALAPSIGSEGIEITVDALGLDPDPSKNRAFFTSRFSAAGAEAPFLTVDRATSRGTVTVPEGAVSGNLFVSVNGRQSDPLYFTVPADFPMCGQITQMLGMADGSLLVQHQYYFFFIGDTSGTPCPKIRWGGHFQRDIVLREYPDGRVDLVSDSDPNAANDYLKVAGIAVDKTGEEHAVLYTQRVNSSSPQPSRLLIYYKNITTQVVVNAYPSDPSYAADFDGAGNLYIAFYDIPERNIKLLKLTREELSRGGPIEARIIASHLQREPGASCGGPTDLVVTCDRYAYLGVGPFWRGGDCPWDLLPDTVSVVRKLALDTGEVIGDVAVTGGIFSDLALTCHADEVLGMTLAAQDFDELLWYHQQIWRSLSSGSPPIPGPAEPVDFLPATGEGENQIAIAPDGTIYTERNNNGIGIIRARYKVPTCDLGGRVTAQPYVCSAGESDVLEILPSTTRWRPQRDDDPISVVVGSSVELDTGQPFTLRYTGKKPDGTVVAATTEVTLPATALGTPPQGYAYGYSLNWNHVDGTGAKLPAGNYTLVMKAPVLSSQSPAPPLESPEYEKVSLVEVVAIAVEDASAVALQNSPPSHGGGKRIFAEAAQSGGTVTDKLKITATILPPVPDAPAGQGVSVHFQSFDVDDPTSSAPPVDDESQPTDNCLDATEGPPQNCPVADAGFLYDPATDPNAANPVNGTTGLQLNASGDQVVAGLRVAMLTGANYRVVASTSSQWLGTLSAPGNRTDGAVMEGTTVLPEGQQVTPMVTVWRTLHLQPVRMTLPSFPQSTLEHQATATCPTAPCILGNLLEDTNGIPHPDHGNMTDAWMGGDLDVAPATPQGAPRSDKHIVTSSTPTTLTTLTQLTPYDPNFDYALWDDEVGSLSIWSQPDDSLARDILRDAYIEVDTVTGVSPNFRQNLSDTAVAALSTATTSALEYWTAPIVLAFEGDAQGKDGDPSTEEYIYGLTNGPEGGQKSRWPRVAIYAETIRDYRATPLANAPANRVSRDEIMTNTTAHEILHMFGLIHDGNRTQGGIMCASLYVDGNEANRKNVTPEQLKLIREATEMKIRRSQVNCP